MEQFAIPGVGAILEKEIDGVMHILLQVRGKEGGGSENGLLEIPAGKVRAFESVYDALRREVLEETGLTVVSIAGEEVRAPYEHGAYKVIPFRPFACAQNTAGTYPILVLVFLCRAEGRLPDSTDEARGYQWVSLKVLENLLHTPERLFPMHLPTLRAYCAYASRDKGGVPCRFES